MYGSLTSGMTYRLLLTHLGFIRGNWAAVIFSLYERTPLPGELVIDGLAVRSDVRGQGVGTKLLEAIVQYAAQKAFPTIRLDVIDINDGARRLYERFGFVATGTEYFEYLRWLLGFGGSTTMKFTTPLRAGARSGH